MNPSEWTSEEDSAWKASAVEIVAKIERVVQSDQDSIEPILGRLMQPELSIRTHMASRRAIASLVELVAALPSYAPAVDTLLEGVYEDMDIPLTQRCLLRAVVLDAFSHLRRVSLPSGSAWKEVQDAPFVQTDIFALPAYGNPASALNMLSNKASLKRVCALIEETGFVGEHSLALLSVPLSVNSLHRVDVLRAVMSLVGSADTIDEDALSPLPASRSSISTLAAHVPKVRGPFLIAGVRMRRTSSGRVLREVAEDPMMTTMNPFDRAIKMVQWRSVVSNIILSAGLRATDLVLRPPTSPVRAQSQARALGMVHEMFYKLGGRPFTMMDFEHVRYRDLPSSPLMMALSAFGPGGIRLAMTKPISLFDVGLGEDFQDVLQEECRPSTFYPASMKQQELMEDQGFGRHVSDDREFQKILNQWKDRSLDAQGE